MRFTIPAINNDYYDEDYLKVFGFHRMGKNVRVHRSVVFMKPSVVCIGDDVTIGPYCVFGDGATTVDDNASIVPFSYFPGTPETAPTADADRIKELEALLAATKANDAAKVKNE